MDRKYRILIVHNQYQLAGGEDTVAENEGKLLSENGNEVFYYVRNNNEINNYGILKKISTGLGTIFSIKSYKEIKKLIVKHNIDIVHVHNTVPLISLSVYFVAKKYKCKLVQSVHNQRMLCPSGLMERNGAVCEQCVTKGLRCAVKNKCYKESKIFSSLLALSMAIHRRIGTYKKVDAYLVTTDFNKKQLLRIPAISEKQIYMKPYYQECAIRGLNEKKRNHFLYIARLERIKGIFVALEAFKELPNERLLIRGTGPDEDAVKKYVQDNNMKNVEFLDYLTKEQMLDYMYDSKAVIIPTQLYEGFPMTIVESFSVGTPVIGSNFGNVGTIIKDHENGLLFEYTSPDDLRKKILEISSDKNLCDRMEKNAQKSYLENHTAEDVYNKTMSIYDII